MFRLPQFLLLPPPPFAVMGRAAFVSDITRLNAVRADGGLGKVELQIVSARLSRHEDRE